MVLPEGLTYSLSSIDLARPLQGALAIRVGLILKALSLRVSSLNVSPWSFEVLLDLVITFLGSSLVVAW